jgi:fatty acid desaturase
VELVLMIVVGIIVALGVLVLAPLLIVGSWFVIITVILGLVDGASWLLDQGWRKIRPEVKPAASLGLLDATSGKQRVPVLTAPLAITSNVAFIHRTD